MILKCGYHRKIIIEKYRDVVILKIFCVDALKQGCVAIMGVILNYCIPLIDQELQLGAH